MSDTMTAPRLKPCRHCLGFWVLVAAILERDAKKKRHSKTKRQVDREKAADRVMGRREIIRRAR